MTLHILEDLEQGSDAWHDQRRGIVTVQLTRGQVALIDASDAEFVLSSRWHALPSRGTFYACRRRGSRIERMHALLTGWTLADHINGNGLDNRRTNLREATSAQNARNRRIGSNNTSGFKGVSWHKGRNKWCAYITADGHRSSLGYYDTPEQAAHAYDSAAIQLHGEFAFLNSIGGAR